MIISTSRDGQTVVVRRMTTMDPFTVYQPRHPRQFDLGHIEGCWYFKPIGSMRVGPESCPYPSLDEAVAAVNVSLEASVI